MVRTLVPVAVSWPLITAGAPLVAARDAVMVFRPPLIVQPAKSGLAGTASSGRSGRLPCATPSTALPGAGAALIRGVAGGARTPKAPVSIHLRPLRPKPGKPARRAALRARSAPARARSLGRA